MLRKPTSGEGLPSAGGPVDDPAFMKSYPTLAEYMFSVVWDDGSPRECSTLLFFVDHPGWKVCLIDKACSRKAFCAAGTFQELLKTLEVGLRTNGLDWRSDKPYGGKKGKG